MLRRIGACDGLTSARRFAIQFVFDRLCLANRPFIEFFQSLAVAAGFIRENHRSDFHLLAHAIESHNGTKEHPDRNIGFWGLSAIDVERRLKPARRVIGEITNGPATQRRQFRAPGQFLSVKEVAQELDRVLVANFGLSVCFDRGLSVAAAHDHPGIRAQKRIASDSLTTLD